MKASQAARMPTGEASGPGKPAHRQDATGRPPGNPELPVGDGCRKPEHRPPTGIASGLHAARQQGSPRARTPHADGFRGPSAPLLAALCFHPSPRANAPLATFPFSLAWGDSLAATLLLRFSLFPPPPPSASPHEHALCSSPAFGTRGLGVDFYRPARLHVDGPASLHALSPPPAAAVCKPPSAALTPSLLLSRSPPFAPDHPRRVPRLPHRLSPPPLRATPHVPFRPPRALLPPPFEQGLASPRGCFASPLFAFCPTAGSSRPRSSPVLPTRTLKSRLPKSSRSRLFFFSFSERLQRHAPLTGERKGKEGSSVRM